MSRYVPASKRRTDHIHITVPKGLKAKFQAALGKKSMTTELETLILMSIAAQQTGAAITLQGGDNVG